MGTQEFGCFPLGMKISQNTSEEGPNPKEKKMPHTISSETDPYPRNDR